MSNVVTGGSQYSNNTFYKDDHWWCSYRYKLISDTFSVQTYMCVYCLLSFVKVFYFRSCSNEWSILSLVVYVWKGEKVNSWSFTSVIIHMLLYPGEEVWHAGVDARSAVVGTSCTSTHNTWRKVRHFQIYILVNKLLYKFKRVFLILLTN